MVHGLEFPMTNEDDQDRAEKPNGKPLSGSFEERTGTGFQSRILTKLIDQKSIE